MIGDAHTVHHHLDKFGAASAGAGIAAMIKVVGSHSGVLYFFTCRKLRNDSNYKCDSHRTLTANDALKGHTGTLVAN